MHAELRTTAAAAQPEMTRRAVRDMIASEVIENVHQQYAAFLQAQLVREAVASAASEANAYHRETAPIRAMARELLGLSPINFAMVTQEETSREVQIIGIVPRDRKILSEVSLLRPHYLTLS